MDVLHFYLKVSQQCSPETWLYFPLFLRVLKLPRKHPQCQPMCSSELKEISYESPKAKIMRHISSKYHGDI